MTRLLERIFLGCGVVLIFDLAFFGPGLVIPGVELSLRRVLLMLMLIVGGLRRFQLRQPFRNDEAALVCGIFLLFVLWAVVLPRSYGFSTADSLADFGPWAGFVVIAVWPWEAWPRESQWSLFRRFLLGVCVVLALLQICIWALIETGIITPELLSFTAKLVAPTESNSAGFIRVALLGNGDYRVYWSSSIFLLGGLYFLVAYRPRPVNKKWVIGALLFGFALWTTYIRAFLAAIGIFLGLAITIPESFWGRSSGRPEGRILMLWLAGILLVSIAIHPAVLDLLHLSRSVSDVERVEQARALIARFWVHPFLGTGFGSYVPQEIRSEGAPYSYELVFYALLMKLGLVGIGMLVVILGMALKVARPRSVGSGNYPALTAWSAFTTGFWFAGATNPLVTNFAGIAILMLLMVDLHRTGEEPEGVEDGGESPVPL